MGAAEVTFSSMLRIRCNQCGEHSPNGYNQSPDAWVHAHRLRHEREVNLFVSS